MDGAPVQLNLGVRLADDATFDNYFEKAEHGVLLASMKSLACGEENGAFLLWGVKGCGITHIMQAVCHVAKERSVHYLPLSECLHYLPVEVCDGLELADIVCVDDVDLVLGNREWELALFHLFNRLKDRGHSVVFGCHQAPSEIVFDLPDLRSRVLGASVFHVASLNDEDKQAALMMRAAVRGMNLSEELARFILSRAPRNMDSLFELLNRLDDVSLQQQRKLTIPFVKETLGW